MHGGREMLSAKFRKSLAHASVAGGGLALSSLAPGRYPHPNRRHPDRARRPKCQVPRPKPAVNARQCALPTGPEALFLAENQIVHQSPPTRRCRSLHPRRSLPVFASSETRQAAMTVFFPRQEERRRACSPAKALHPLSVKTTSSCID